jgi:hypothetical protein
MTVHPGCANPLVGRAVNLVFPQRSLSIIEIGIIKTDKSLEPAVIIDPAHPEHANWRLIIAAPVLKTHPAATQSHFVEHFNGPVTLHDLQLISLGIH